MATTTYTPAWEARYSTMIDGAAAETFRRYSTDISTALFLYNIPAGHDDGRILVLSHDDALPPRADLILGRHIPRDLDVAGLRRWIRQFTGRVSLIGWAS